LPSERILAVDGGQNISTRSSFSPLDSDCDGEVIVDVVVEVVEEVGGGEVEEEEERCSFR